MPGKVISALQLAARCGRITTVEILLEERAKVNQPAAVDGHSLTVEFLLEECSEVNVLGAELWAAAEGSNFPIVDRLGARLKSLTSHKGKQHFRPQLEIDICSFQHTRWGARRGIRLLSSARGLQPPSPKGCVCPI